ncbi:hypothetical protein D3C87_1257640 [compost metagenome]
MRFRNSFPLAARAAAPHEAREKSYGVSAKKKEKGAMKAPVLTTIQRDSGIYCSATFVHPSGENVRNAAARLAVEAPRSRS